MMERSLSGRRIVITRAQEQSADLARELEALGAEVLRIPTIQIVPPQSYQPLDRALKKIPSYDWLVLTSTNGVHALSRRLEHMQADAGLLRHMKVCAIGPATREAIEKLGLKVTVTPAEYVAESLVAVLRDQVKGKKVLLLRAKVARDLIPHQLREAGAEVDIAEAYETIAAKSSRARLRSAFVETAVKPDAVTFTSSSTVKNFVSLLGQGVSLKQALEGVAVASIGPVTSATLRENGMAVTVEAKEFTTAGVSQALSDYFQKQPKP